MRPTALSLWIFVPLCLFLCSPAPAADNWPEFRGPGGMGHSEATNLPLHFSETENVRWKTAIPGKAWSSPVVWGERIWLSNATEDGKRMSAVCVDRRSGKIIHDLLLFENEKPAYCHPVNSYASPTPVIEAGRVYLHFGTFGTACLDTKSGETLWTRRDLNVNHHRGPGSSPILTGGTLFLTFDGFDKQFVVALDKQTGRTLWRKDRTINYGTNNGDWKKAFGTPLLVEAAGRKQLVSPAATATIAYDPASGKELWTLYHGGMNVAARPLYGHGLLFISGGPMSEGLLAVRPDGSGNITDTHVAWKFRKSIPKRSTHLLIDDLLFLFSDNGVATCLDAKTGKAHWQRRHRPSFWASPIYADGRIYAFDKDGLCLVFAPTSDYQLLATNRLASGFMATPAAVGNSLIARSKTHLYCLEKANGAEGR